MNQHLRFSSINLIFVVYFLATMAEVYIIVDNMIHSPVSTELICLIYILVTIYFIACLQTKGSYHVNIHDLNYHEKQVKIS